MFAWMSTPARARRVDLRDRARTLRPVVRAGGLEVIDLDRHAALRADRDRFVDRLEQLVGLGAHVRDVDAAVRRHRFRHLDQLVGRRVVARRIDERRADAERAIFHRAADDGAHRVELRGRRLADRFALRVHAHRRRADERADVRRDAVRLHRVEPRAESVRARNTRRCRAGRRSRTGRRPRSSRSSARASTPSPRISVVMPCVTLLTERPSPRKFVPLWMSMKPGATTSPRASMRCFAGNRWSDPAGADARDAIADDRDVAGEPGGAGAVDDAAVLEHDVEWRSGSRRRGRRRVGAGGEREAARRRGVVSSAGSVDGESAKVATPSS